MQIQNTHNLLDRCENDKTDLIPQIRNTTRALIRRNKYILLLRKEYDDGRFFFTFPGGGQELGETLVQALNRECLEEIGTEVKVENLLHVADFFKPRDTVPPTTRHLVEFFFECTVPGSYTPRNGHRPDRHQVAVVWKDITQLSEENFLLPIIASYLNGTANNSDSVYLGRFG